ncbi:ATP-binding protein [Methylobacterium sp. J-090]|uniref:PAS domain-containing sensor histidine kinase n=1 Tax=Methylobacterium sp. J-090 TaxID=2836666 RepID=UPI001FBBE6B0|nr:ATP-binding protein [Methylobacterium sp. J-090]MCJ2081900.1 ATP-binding protein [Methylobacterium sp. J-090]
MFDNGVEGPGLSDDAALDAMVRGLEGDLRLGPFLRRPDRALIILDETGARLVHASRAAGPVARAITGTDGAVVAGLRMGAQIRATAQPTLARIRFDRRGLATPTTCFVLRASVSDGRAVLVLILTEPSPRLRPIGPDGPAGTVTAHAPAEGSAAGADDPDEAAGPGAVPRFTWQTDAAGTLVRVGGPAGGLLRGALLGRSWDALSRAGIARDAEGLIAVLDAHRTFRAIPLCIRLPDPDRIVELDLSGVPLARAGQAARGFAGFGLVRRTEVAPVAEAAPVAEISAEAGATEGPPSTAVAGLPPEHRAHADAAPAERDHAPEPTVDASLTTHEHAAFREIARALGARFAGDESAEASPEGERANPGGAVMPFPGPLPRVPEPAAPEAALAATLERLPTGVLVYRDEGVLFANRTLLDLAGFADLDALAAAGGIAHLFQGLPPHERTASDAPAILTTREGSHRGVDLQRSAIDWCGRPAEILLARDAAADEPVRALTAERIAQDFAAHRARDAIGILDALDEGVVTLDGSARILDLNRAAAALFGADPREVVGESLLSLFVPESTIDVLAVAHGVPEGAARHVIARGPDGPLPLRLEVRAVSDTAEPRLCAILRPVPGKGVGTTDESREARAFDPEALRLAEMASARKSEFLARISHAIRTPMSGILGFTDLMLAEPFGPLGSDRYRDYLDDIRKSGTEVVGLVDDLIDLARIEAGRLDLDFAEIPLNDLVSRCVAQMQPEAARERIVVRTSFSADLAPLVADERSLRQAAMTVIANAIRFTEAGGQVIVTTTMADRGEIVLRVRDTGIGLTPDEVDALLEPYRAAPVQGPRPGGGTGLGLPITKALVEANRGEFRITSRKDEGTLVEMLFPSAQASRRAGA